MNGSLLLRIPFGGPVRITCLISSIFGLALSSGNVKRGIRILTIFLLLIFSALARAIWRRSIPIPKFTIAETTENAKAHDKSFFRQFGIQSLPSPLAANTMVATAIQNPANLDNRKSGGRKYVNTERE